MKKAFASIVLIIVLGLVNVSVGQTDELSGYVAFDAQVFASDPLYPGQQQENFSFAIQPEYYREWESGSSFIFTPFFRLDKVDSKRSHFDIRELNSLWHGESWEMRLGIGKVFWGAVEYVHLVDIINQTDFVENIDGEEKLGQPMAHLSLQRDWGVVDLFVLPFFRERTFPGQKGRLRSPIVVDSDKARYESSAKERNIDFAMRYSHSIADLDFGIHYFKGTGREPTLSMELVEGKRPVLVPYYHQINQTGLDLQGVAGEWLYKMEAIYRKGQIYDYIALAGGIEYTFLGLAETNMDLGIFVQMAYDDRDKDATTFFENDAMLGLRFAFNDPAGTELISGLIKDVNNSSMAISIEASSRFGSAWRMSIESWIFLNVPKTDPSYSMRDDDFMRLELAYYF